jgi:hypothetical protein
MCVIIPSVAWTEYLYLISEGLATIGVIIPSVVWTEYQYLIPEDRA